MICGEIKMKGNIMKNKGIKKLFWLLLLPLLVFLLVTYLGNVLTIGDKIGNITGAWGEVIVDIILIFAPLALLFWKIKEDFLGYKFVCLNDLYLENTSIKEIDDFIDNVVEKYDNEELPASLKEALLADSRTDKKIAVKKYIGECEKKSAAVGREIALLAALSVVVSPRRMTDTLGMLFWNFRIISKVLEIYGVRPSGLALIKLYCYVLFSSLLVGSIEEVMDHFNPPEIKAIPFLSPLTQAVATIYACLKTVKLTQYYLQHGVDADKSTALKEARIYAFKSLPEIWKDATFTENLKKVFDLGMDFVKDKFYSFWSDLFSGKNKDCRSDKAFDQSIV